TVFWGECLKIQKRQLTRNELVALNFLILGISLHTDVKVVTIRGKCFYILKKKKCKCNSLIHNSIN
ncbi:MAG: hypothetical protein EGQ20_00765, partial [Bacteroides oleiciplenus]|nr:hypothetical protein [Bacteroides oleiciplenus]